MLTTQMEGLPYTQRCAVKLYINEQGALQRFPRQPLQGAVAISELAELKSMGNVFNSILNKEVLR